MTLAAMDVVRALVPEIAADRSMRGRERRIVAQGLVKAVNATELWLRTGRWSLPHAAALGDVWFRALRLLEAYRGPRPGVAMGVLMRVVREIAGALRG